MKKAQDNGATLVITHRVKDSQKNAYENWMTTIGHTVKQAPGFLDLQAIHPVANLTRTYTIVLRFASHKTLGDWMASESRTRLLDAVAPLLAYKGDYTTQNGIDFLFQGETRAAKAPVRWKQCLVTWSAIFPLVLLFSTLIPPALRLLGIPPLRLVDTFAITVAVVVLMVYGVMPIYTRAIKGWLFR